MYLIYLIYKSIHDIQGNTAIRADVLMYEDQGRCIIIRFDKNDWTDTDHPSWIEAIQVVGKIKYQLYIDG